MLIYPKRFKSKLEKIKRNIKDEKGLMLQDVLVNYDNNISTISYNECVNSFKKYYEISDIEEMNLRKLGNIRNKLTRH
ncbi:hypothetical protein EDC19_1328 [Natranaerovirga hydrolytica]|uniref:Uncharacterized protein n=1 Tax=Natranaerovirga hydrolytica TaxID=680378 RepID=A0A4R1MK14_9FIRM|nr:hypothetical protein EDC19_1328 [Natranaerovirga hydrolytica]